MGRLQQSALVFRKEARLVPGPGGMLLTLTFSGNLDAINPATGVASVVGSTGLGGNGDTIGEVGGTVYATDFNSLPPVAVFLLTRPAGVPPFVMRLSSELGGNCMQRGTRSRRTPRPHTAKP